MLLEAIDIYRHLATPIEAYRGRSPIDYLGSLLNNLAEVYEEQGAYKNAETFYRRALDTWEKAGQKEQVFYIFESLQSLPI